MYTFVQNVSLMKIFSFVETASVCVRLTLCLSDLLTTFLYIYRYIYIFVL